MTKDVADISDTFGTFSRNAVVCRLAVGNAALSPAVPVYKDTNENYPSTPRCTYAGDTNTNAHIVVYIITVYNDMQ